MAKFTCRDCTRFLLLAKECQKKSLNEAMVGWLSLCPLTLHLPLGRLKVAKKSKYSQNFVNLMCLNINWMKSYDIILLRINFLKVKMHHFRGNLLKWVLTPQKETSSRVFKMTIFKKFFGAFMRHIIR